MTAQHQARKRFGQNFLVDESVVDAIVRAIRPRAGESLIEIGPGLSALTAPLIAAAGHLTAIEIDRDLAARLRKLYPADQLTVVEADVLTVDPASLGLPPPWRFVGNLPYNISSPLLFHLLEHADQVADQHFMLQREVVDRLVAEPGSSDYSRLSVMVQLRYHVEKLFEVPPEAFDPAPRVVSAVVRMVPRRGDWRRPKDAALFAEVVSRAFAQRRKMLRGNLALWADRIDWDAVGIKPTDRAEQVSLEQFLDLADSLSRNVG